MENLGMKKYYCKCGKPIWIDYKFNGFIVIPLYFDIKDGKALEITECVNCGEKIIFYDLKKEI
jgi:hypothetical protein